MAVPPTDRDFDFRCVCGEILAIHPIYAGRLAICSRCATPVLLPPEPGCDAEELGRRLSLETARLRLELAKAVDWRRLLPMASDPENYRFETCPPDTGKSLRRTLMRNRFPAGFRKHLTLRFVGSRLGDGEPVGTIHVQLERDHLTASLGIMIHHPFQGMGFGTECLAAIDRFAFQTLKLFRLSAACDPENKASVALFRSAEFAEEGRLHRWMFHPQRGWIDCMLFAKLADGS